MLPLELMVSFLTALSVVGIAGFVFFVFRYYHLFGLVSQLSKLGKATRASYGAEGGVVSVAKKGSKNFLGDLIKTGLANMSGGLSELAREGFPVIDDWLEKNPYAVIYAMTMLSNIPAVQGFLQKLTSGDIKIPELPKTDGQGMQRIPMVQPNQNRVVEYIGKEKEAWWQA